jgi:hypothetical protein
VRAVIGDLERLGYRVYEVRGTGQVVVRVAGDRLETSELWVMPS